MEPFHSEQDPQPDDRIALLINEYFDRRQAGESLTPESFAIEHPALAEDLRPYLDGLTLLDKIRPAAVDAAGPTGSDVGGAEFPAIEGYDVLNELGRGGMGVVYKALQVSTKRIVALKVMLAGPFASGSARHRFEREVELAARLQHPHIVRVLESGCVAQQQYYSMDYVAGISLDRYLAAAQPDVRDTLAMFRRICEAVEYAHGHGVIHRDLKPANVLVDEDGNPHILDFGLAKATDPAEPDEAPITRFSVPGQVMGSLPYLSPEQAAGKADDIDVRTDVYSLGVMLFQALTGSTPFDTRGRPSEILERIVESPPTPPSSLSNRVDNELETIILKTLEKEKTRRYQSAEDLAEDLRRYVDGEPILAKRPSSFYFLRKKVLKHRRAAVLGVLALAVGLTVLWVHISSRQQESARARRDAMLCLRDLERGATGPRVGQAQALSERYRQLPEAVLLKAQSQYRFGAPEQAIVTLQRGLRDDASQWARRMLLAEIYRETSGTKRANALQARAERDAPDTADGWYLRSFATVDAQRALRYLQEAVTRQPSHVLAWERLTWLRVQTDDLDGALQGTEKLMELGQDAAEWTFYKGSFLARQGRFPEAIEQYTLVTRSARRSGAAYCYRAHAYRRVRQYDKAVADYDKAAELEGERSIDVWTFYQRATPLWILGRTDEALEDYRRVRADLGRPSYADARRFLILREMGRLREGEEVLQAALRDVENPWLGLIFRCLGAQLSPEDLIADALARDNIEHICEAYYYAGEACLLSGQLTDARKWFEQCVQTGVEFDPDTAPGTPMNEYELALWRLESLPDGTQASHSQETDKN